MQGSLFATNNLALTLSLAGGGTRACEITQLLNRVNKTGIKSRSSGLRQAETRRLFF